MPAAVFLSSGRMPRASGGGADHCVASGRPWEVLPLALSGRVIQNPATGECIAVRPAGPDGGALLQFDLILPPGRGGPACHAHPEQRERFTVLSGCLRLRIGRSTVDASTGSAVEVPPGTAHRFCNPGPDSAHVLVEVWPALHFEDLLAAAAQIERKGLGPVARLSALAAALLSHPREVSVPGVPRQFVRLALTVAAALGRRGQGAVAGAPAVTLQGPDDAPEAHRAVG